MKTNTLIGLSLFFLGSFSLIVGALRFPSVEFYTGGIVIALFVAGLFYSWGNTIRQAREIGEKQQHVVPDRPTEGTGDANPEARQKENSQAAPA